MSDDEPRLRTRFWIQAQLRQCDLAAIPFIVRKRGDDDAGAVLLCISKLNGVVVMAREYGVDGKRQWRPALGDGPVSESEAEAYIARQTARDPDIWVIDVDDPSGRYQPT